MVTTVRIKPMVDNLKNTKPHESTVSPSSEGRSRRTTCRDLPAMLRNSGFCGHFAVIPAAPWQRDRSFSTETTVRRPHNVAAGPVIDILNQRLLQSSSCASQITTTSQTPTMASLVRRSPLVFPPTARHTATVIFVHGLGDTGHGWSDAVENWRRRQKLDEVKFVLPHAPHIPITANWSQKMPGWYDIVSRYQPPPPPSAFRSSPAAAYQAAIDGSVEGFRKNEDEAGILVSQAYFHDLIQKEIDSGIPSNRIVLGGFSQGGAMSLFAGLTAKVKLAGIVALSSYLLLSLKFAEMVPSPSVNKETPIFMAHGTADQVVNFPMGKLSYDFLKEKGYNVTFKQYEGMGHSACLEELDEIEQFLRSRLPALGKDQGKSEL